MRKNNVLIIFMSALLILAIAITAAFIVMRKPVTGFPADELPKTDKIYKVQCYVEGDRKTANIWDELVILEDDDIASFVDSLQALKIVESDEGLEAIPNPEQYTLFRISAEGETTEIVVYNNYMSINGSLYKTEDGSDIDLKSLMSNFEKNIPEHVENE